MTAETDGRRVVANIAVSLDGRYGQPQNPDDMSWVVPYATSQAARDRLTNLHQSSTTAVLGRGLAEGFLGFWPTLIGQAGTDPQDEAFAKWLLDCEKVVFSSTLDTAPWQNTTIVNRPVVEVIDELKATEGGDIWLMTSPSIIKPLLAADRVDRLGLVVCPLFLGGGPRLFDDGLPHATWELAEQETSANGTMCVYYDRIR